jgi:glycosyltransferase A (GT-A) superfamily protein (DUF2064 family)
VIAAAAVVLAERAFSPELIALLGAERAAALADLLLRRAVAWAERAAREVIVVEPADLAGAADVIGPPGGHRSAPDLAAALAAAPPAGGVLLVRAEVPRLGADHAADALGDLAAGCALTFGSTLEGDWYLAGLAAPEPELLAAVPGGELRAGGVGVALDRARALGAEVGLLRHERALRRPADAAAHLADPLTPADVRAALSGASS